MKIVKYWDPYESFDSLQFEVMSVISPGPIYHPDPYVHMSLFELATIFAVLVPAYRGGNCLHFLSLI